ncbi:MAG: hypothetical protein J7L42_04365 [Elusimicrobia bacterium]|nr:hypothetical protein [Elusimicrobiota bacterium]
MTGDIFSVARARFYEKFLFAPDFLEKMKDAATKKEIFNMISGRALFEVINETSPYGIDAFIDNVSADFRWQADINFFTQDLEKLTDIIESSPYENLKEITKRENDPFKIYEFLWNERKKNLGKIEGIEVVFFVFLSILWQMRILRMILKGLERGITLSEYE